ncbi:MAG: intradiol ring-cleavage dioxygenase [Pseudomonadota bacterium]|nr:intradiol ring-cleavage dioxygenase [Pseudomonadota bacterium]
MTVHNPGRRRFLALTGATIGGAAIMPRSAVAAQTPAATSRLLIGQNICRLTPEVTEGPYYFDPKLVRRDITEGHAGIPLKLRMQVVDADCLPIEGARVDLWHCNASGLYSNYAGQGDDREHPVSTKGETFLRGTQMADEGGVVEFLTIYPGWYRGRTTHMHFKVFTNETTRLTGQIFFPDALSAYIYQNIAPYSDRQGERDTINANDWIAKQAGDASFAYVKEGETAYEVALIVGVDPSAKSVQSAPPPPPDGVPPEGPPPQGFGGPPPGGARGPDGAPSGPPLGGGSGEGQPITPAMLVPGANS